MSFKRIVENFPYGIKSCDGLMFVYVGCQYYIYKDKKWTMVNGKSTVYLNVITFEKIININYIEMKSKCMLKHLNLMMTELLTKKIGVLTTKMMIFDASNDVRLSEITLMIAKTFFELGIT